MKKSKNTEYTATEKIAIKTEGFFQRNIKWLIIVAILIVLAVAAVAIVSVVNNNKNEENFNAVYSLEQSYNNLLTLDDTTSEYTTASDAFLADADALIAGAKGYPSLKAEYLKGLYYANVEDYANALTAFESVANKSNDTYLGPLALMNAAAVAENNGDQAKALEYFNKVWDDYGADAAESPKALFNIGRIYESQGDVELAKATYQQLVDQYSTTSEYAKLAESRIVLL